MYLVSLNDAAITICGILGIGVFYWIGKKHREENGDDDDGNGNKKNS